VDREDEVVAIASAWLDRRNGVGLFEPVGTRTAYRRLGLARAAMAANLRRLAQRGASSAVVRVRNANVAARACYESLGFTIASDDFGFERSLGERLLAGMDKR
jgi:ribosomal protein S18 acetylase RimI-like enzyme